MFSSRDELLEVLKDVAIEEEREELAEMAQHSPEDALLFCVRYLGRIAGNVTRCPGTLNAAAGKSHCSFDYIQDARGGSPESRRERAHHPQVERRPPLRRGVQASETPGARRWYL